MRIFTVLLVSAMMVVVAGKSYAADTDDVKAAIVAYHAALEALDASKMEALWAQDDSVTLINPFDKGISVGWAAAKKDWEVGLGNIAQLKLAQTDGPYIQVKGDMARSVAITTCVTLQSKGGPVLSNVPVYESDAFEKRDGKWLLISHVALLVPQK